jgi:peptidoglycan/LPS O-acetylase OafA/YrhL
MRIDAIDAIEALRAFAGDVRHRRASNPNQSSGASTLSFCGENFAVAANVCVRFIGKIAAAMRPGPHDNAFGDEPKVRFTCRPSGSCSNNLLGADMTKNQHAVTQIQALTGLRAFLAIWVVTRHLFHAFDAGPFFDLGMSVPLFDKGYLGVDGFFILSGFILAYNYANDSNGRPFSYREFISARFARVYPVHFVCLFAAAAMILFKEHHLHKHIIGTDQTTWLGFAQNLVLLNAWSLKTITGWNDVAWSVSAEWFAYVFFPLFVLLAPARNRVMAMIALLLPIAALVLIEWNAADHLSLPGGLSRLVPEFYAGVLLCRIRRIGAFADLPMFTGTAAIALVLAGVFIGSDSLSVVGLGVLVFALSSRMDWIARPLSLAWVVYLGEVSYCLYMVQRFPLEALSFARKQIHFVGALPMPVQMLIFFAALLLSAMALHHVIENPVRGWLNRTLRGRTKAASAVEQEKPAHAA